MNAAAPPSFVQKMYALVALAGVSTAIGVAMKLSQVKGRYSFSPISAVAVTELYKLVVSLFFIARLVLQDAAERGVPAALAAGDFARENYSIPLLLHNVGLGLAYAVVNLVTFGVFVHAPASVFFLLKAASPVVTALMLAVLVKRPISPQQWGAIIAQCVGLFTTQYNPCSAAPALSTAAYVFIFINIAVSCAAGVWNEHVIKTHHTSVNAQNSMMYLAGVVVNVLLFFMMSPETIGADPSLGFFDGYNWSVGAVIVANGSVGLVITAVYKYADVVVKTFGLAGSTVFLFALETVGALPTGKTVPGRPSALVGGALVLYAAYVYIAPPVLEMASATSRKPAAASPAPEDEVALRSEAAVDDGQGEGRTPKNDSKPSPNEEMVPVGLCRNGRVLMMGLLGLAAVGGTWVAGRLCA